jgi:hypothetical protein
MSELPVHVSYDFPPRRENGQSQVAPTGPKPGRRWEQSWAMRVGAIAAVLAILAYFGVGFHVPSEPGCRGASETRIILRLGRIDQQTAKKHTDMPPTVELEIVKRCTAT